MGSISKKQLAACFITLLFYLLVFVPLWTKGYIITLDMAFGPADFGLLPAQIIQHLIFAFLFMTGPLVAMWCISQIPRQKIHTTSLIIGGLFYLYNPFVYQRFLAGHRNFLLGYVLMPLAVGFMLRLLSKFSRRDLAGFCLALLLTMLTDSHFVFILGIFIIVFLLLKLTDLLHKDESIRNIGITLIAIAASFLLVFVLSAAVQTKVANIISEDFYYYAGRPDSEHGIIYSLLTLHGFWREGNEMLVIKDHPLWPFGLLTIATLILTGISALIQKIQRDNTSVFILLSGLIAFVLALGVAPQSYEITDFLNKFVPFYTGMREPQKFLAVIVLIYSLLLSLGLDSLQARLNKPHLNYTLVRRGIGALALAALLSVSVYMYFGFSGQIKPARYPDSWHQAKEYLEQNDPQATLVELPHYLYLKYPWNDRYSATVVEHFFTNPVIKQQYAGTEPKTDHIQRANDQLFACFDELDLTCFEQQAKEQGAKYLVYNKVQKNIKNFELNELTQAPDLKLLFEDQYSAFFELNTI